MSLELDMLIKWTMMAIGIGSPLLLNLEEKSQTGHSGLIVLLIAGALNKEGQTGLGSDCKSPLTGR